MRSHGPRAGPPRPKIPVPERALQRLITDWLALAGVLFTVTDAAMIAGEDGRGAKTLTSSKVTTSWPDVSACLPGRGRALYVETKTVDGHYQPGQREMLDRLAAAGALVVVPRRLSDLVDALELEYGRDVDAPELWRLRRAIVSYRTGTGAA